MQARWHPQPCRAAPSGPLAPILCPNSGQFPGETNFKELKPRMRKLAFHPKSEFFSHFWPKQISWKNSISCGISTLSFLRWSHLRTASRAVDELWRRPKRRTTTGKREGFLEHRSAGRNGAGTGTGDVRQGQRLQQRSTGKFNREPYKCLHVGSPWKLGYPKGADGYCHL